jgi:SAM-dependent methyltransferase
VSPESIPRRTSYEGRGAGQGTSEYRGLRVFAAPGLHEHVADLAGKHWRAGAEVLDLGAGTGALSLRLADAGFQVTGADLVEENFAARPSAEFVRADLEQDFLAGREGSFAGVAAVEIIEHLENPRRFLRRAAQLLEPGGVLIVTTPNAASPVSKARFVRTGRFQWFTDEDRRDLGHLSPLTPWHLRDALAGAGLELSQLGSFGDARERVRGWRSLLLLARGIAALARPSGDPRGDLLVATASAQGRGAG